MRFLLSLSLLRIIHPPKSRGGGRAALQQVANYLSATNGYEINRPFILHKCSPMSLILFALGSLIRRTWGVHIVYVTGCFFHRVDIFAARWSILLVHVNARVQSKRNLISVNTSSPMKNTDARLINSTLLLSYKSVKNASLSSPRCYFFGFIRQIIFYLLYPRCVIRPIINCTNIFVLLSTVIINMRYFSPSKNSGDWKLRAHRERQET